MKRLLNKTLLSLSLVVSSFVATAEVNVEQLIKEAEQAAYYAGEDGKSMARMLIVDAQGRKQSRQFAILRKDVEDGGDQKMLVFFAKPADVKGTVFRVEKHVDSQVDDDRWLYLPGLDLVKRISAGDKRTSFVGSHFFYEDVSGRSIEEDNFTFVKTTDAVHVLKAVPKNPDSVEFAHYRVSIDKTTKLPVKIDFYNSKQELYRTVEAVKVGTVGGYPTVLRSKVTDVKNGGYTLMEFRKIKYDLGLPDSIFSERSLRTPPTKWLRK